MFSRLIITTRTVQLSMASDGGSLPATISYKGILTDGGKPVAARVSVLFAIHPDPVEGTAIWTDTREVTSDSDGLVTVLLGHVTPIHDGVLTHSPLFLAVELAGATSPVPRTIVTLASDTSRLDASPETVNRVADVVQDGRGVVQGVRDPGGNVGGGVSVSGVRDPGGNIDGAKSA